MFDRQRKTAEPCAGCRMHVNFCFCSEIPRIDTRTRVSVLIHVKELKRTTNTGRLATLALTNSALFVRGLRDQEIDVKALADETHYEPVLFFPSDDAEELAPSEKPLHLIVPDGNWRQASKVHTRYPEFKNLRRVKISAKNTATHFLRKETTPEGMATLQAIAEALGIAESREVRDQLMKVYDLKLMRTLKARGTQVEI
jgi:DTW domain-containing protein YfiP